ncbi:MAG: hypothetical protein HFF59_02970 [Lawsonibacter sp.]|nr:hypothetical protein [Lawsonibacter sp.]
MEQKRKRSVFYWVLLGILILLLLVFVYIRFGLLRPWLTRYEASQPKHVSQEVFDDLFSPADWGRVFDLAGLEGDRERFVEALEELMAGQELTLVETSAGLSGDRRYLVKSGTDSVAAFTLTGETEEKTAAWKLGQVELLLELPSNTLLVRTLDSHRVLVDGEELGVDCQVQLTETAAERYLPEGVLGRRTILWQTRAGTAGNGGVTVLDADGETVPLDLDPETGVYTVRETAEEPADEEYAALTGAAKSYARYMIRQGDAAQLRRYFDSSSAIYQTICSSEIWIRQTSGHTFSNERVSEFQRYGEDIFSARVSMHLDVQRGNGSAKPYEIDSTFFFHKQNGGWRAFEMTNMDVQEEIVHSRLVFMDGEQELGRLFVSSGERSFTPPAVEERPGRHFAGWATRGQEGGSVTMTLQFQPKEDGTVTLPAGLTLEPMTLYAVFE